MEKSKTFVKTDRNGTAYYTVVDECPRCGGSGIFEWASYRGQMAGTCFACGGSGRGREHIVKVYTPEYEAKRAARAAAKQAALEASPAYQAKLQAEAEAREAQRRREAEEAAAEEAAAAAEAARRQISQPVGVVGDKLRAEVTVEAIMAVDGKFGGSALHRLRDEAGNLYIWWASGSGLCGEDGLWLPKGAQVRIQGTVKAHDTFGGEWQTVLSRVKAL